MPSSSGVDKYDIKVLLCSVCYRVFGDVRCIFAVTLFVELYLSQVLSFRQLFEIPRMNTKLLNGPGSESIASGNEQVEFVLKEEEG